jgi:hypothetical protein
MDLALGDRERIPHRIFPDLLVVEDSSFVYRREDSRCMLVLVVVVGTETCFHIGDLVDMTWLSCVVGGSGIRPEATHYCLMKEAGSHSYGPYSPF